jgi:hypothetical protein
MCQGESVVFNEVGFDFYQWTTTANLNCSDCASVVVSPSSSSLLVLEAGFANGCVNRDSAIITVYDTFNYAVDTMICWGRQVNWNGLNIPPDSSATFKLQTVHGCDSTLMVRVMGTTVGTFNHLVDTAVCLGATLPYLNFELNWGEEKTFNLSAVTGCDSIVKVRVAPLDTFYLEEARRICFGETSSIFGTPQSTEGVYVGAFKTQRGCDSTHVVYLQVLPQIQLEIDATTACFGESNGALSVNVPNGVNPLQFSWNISGATTPVLNNISAGNYALTVTDGLDCTETQAVTVESYPAYSFTASTDSVSCFGLSDGSISIESPDTTLMYTLNNGAFVQSTQFDDLVAKDYEILAQDIFGCQDTLLASVLEPPLLKVDLPADTTIQLGVSVPLQIGLIGLPPTQWIWSDTSYLSCVACPNPLVQTPLETIRYNLTVVDENGCISSDVMLLSVDPLVNVYIPNAMGGQGANSRFEINFGPAVQEINMLRIFDRWGSMLHEVKGAFPGDASIAWDGRQNGSLVNPGVYVWMIELKLVDGQVIQKKGDITVVR